MTRTATEPSPFGAMLQHLRRRAGLSQQELAERAGLSLRGIADLERGARRTPYPVTVRRLVEALGLDDAARATLLAAAQPCESAGGPAQVEPARSLPLPLPLSSFVGREDELAEVKRLLESSRLVTLTGTGGIGKTRLALTVAREWMTKDREVGTLVAFVDLASLADPELVPQAVSAQLGVPEQPGRHVLASLMDALQGRPGLVVLDNCEHLVPACATLAYQLLTACPDLRIVATSREPLGIAGETLWRVPSLSVPEPPLQLEQVASSEAVRLFAERARAVQPTFELRVENARAVAEVCQRLDGIPLALELAAARVSMLSVEQIAARLDDALGLLVAGRRLAPARQQTVRATLDWSYALLSEPERVLFERLAVFAGGWTLDAAEAVAGTDGLESREVLALLGRLVDTSMVVVEPGPAGQMRYRLLEPLRQYGDERLAERGSAEALRGRHAAYFLALAEQVEPDLSSPRVKAAQVRLEADHDNLRAALDWLLVQEDVDGVQRLAGALGRFWFFRGHLAEADAWLSRTLSLPGGDRPTAGRAKCLYGVTMLALGRGDYPAAERHAHETRALWHALGNTAQEAFALFHLGLVSTRLGKHADARAYLQAGLEMSRAARHGGAETNCLFTLADLAIDLGHDDEARGWAEAALARATEIGQARQIAGARGFLGVLSMRQGDYAGAAAWLEASLATWRELGERYWIAETLVRLGQLAIEQRDLGTARTRLVESLGLAQKLGDKHRIAAALEGFVQVAVLEEQPRLAVQLAAAAESVRASIRVPLPPAERSRLNGYLARARSALGVRAAEPALIEGRALGIHQAVDLALTSAQPLGMQQDVRRGRPLLTAREEAVVRLIAQGLTNRQIAEQLVIAEGTAERHVGNILAKLEMTTRTQIAAWAVGAGVLQSPPTT